MARQRIHPSDEPQRPTTTSYNALRLKQNKHLFYFSTIPIDDLFPYCFVARRENDPSQGFQRTLSEERAEDIAKYLADGSGSIPSNVVLSAQSTASFRYVSKKKSISYRREKYGFLVLDGQHRLWGYQKCRERHRVPVAIYEGLDRAMEAKLFIDINTNQRGVPAALLLDIKRLAEIESQKEEILRELFDRLAKDPDSPVAGKLSAAKSVAHKLSRVTFNRAVGEALDGTVLSTASAELRYKLIKNYLAALADELRDRKILTKSAFFSGALELFDEAVRTSKARFTNAKSESLREVLRPVAQIDYSHVQSTRKAMVVAMRAALRAEVSVTDADV